MENIKVRNETSSDHSIQKEKNKARTNISQSTSKAEATGNKLAGSTSPSAEKAMYTAVKPHSGHDFQGSSNLQIIPVIEESLAPELATDFKGLSRVERGLTEVKIPQLIKVESDYI